ncbi:YqfO family protein [Endozoicomonas lisbonensis]|uniref:NGG1p interacting factor NIF3 n=1 Tax=Endozoicomonas lisbonensis TaxID=3120522 RepID=A0ABV2SBY1_9GAMM
MHKLCFFVPASHLEAVKDAVFNAGAGHFGNYDRCCWQTLGQGQFRGLENSTPFLGVPGELEYVGEYKVEVICPDEKVDAAVSALRQAHPYEEPAFEVWPVRQFPLSGAES